MRLFLALALAACAQAVPVVPAVIPDADVIPLAFLQCGFLTTAVFSDPSKDNDSESQKKLDQFNTYFRPTTLDSYFDDSEGSDDRIAGEQTYAAIAGKMTPTEKARYDRLGRNTVFTKDDVKLCREFLNKLAPFISDG